MPNFCLLQVVFCLLLSITKLFSAHYRSSFLLTTSCFLLSAQYYEIGLLGFNLSQCKSYQYAKCLLATSRFLLSAQYYEIVLLGFISV